MMCSLLLCLTVLLVLCLFLKHHYSHWTRLKVTQSSFTEILTSTHGVVFQKKNIGLVLDDLYRKHSTRDAVGLYQFHTPKLMVRSPDLVQRVLVTDFASFRDNEALPSRELKSGTSYLEFNPFVTRGEQWKLARNTLLSGLSTKKLKDFYSLMKQSIPQLFAYIDSCATQDIEAKEFSSLFVMTNVSNSVFGIESNCFTDKKAPFRKMADMLQIETWQSWWQVMILFFFPTVRDVLGFRLVPKKVTMYVEHMVRKVAQNKLQSRAKRNDFFQYFLNRVKPDEENIHDITCLGMTFFMAGMETSSISLSTALYELALNPEIQERLHQELQAAYGEEAELLYETLLGLPYLDQVLKESLRKYPVLYSLSKICTKSIELEVDGESVTIGAGTHVAVPVFAIHRDPQHYPDPERFDPERFSREDSGSEGRAPYTYLPFGEGPRICPGKKFAEAQMKLFLASVVHKYKILPTPRTPPKLDFLPGALLVVSDSQEWIRFEKRNK